MRILRATLLAAAVPTLLCAQTTHLVGPNGLPQINDALAIAGPGDVIVVEPGPAYHPITVNLGVVIRALNPSSIPNVSVLGAVCAIPAGQELHMVGLRLTGNVGVTAGRVTFDWCDLTAATGLNGPEVLRISNAAVHLQDTLVAAGVSPPGTILRAINSSVTAAGCSIQGLLVSSVLPPCVLLENSRFHATDCSIWVAAFGSSFVGVGIRAENGSEVWLSDSTVNQPTPNSCAIESVASTVRVDRSSLSQGTSPLCTTGSGGGFLLGVERMQPLAIGQTFALDYHTAPNNPVFVFVGLSLDTIDLTPWLEQPSWLAQSNSFQVSLLVADSAGLATGSWPIPNNPAFSNFRLWWKGISGLAVPLQVSPPVGGMVR